MIIKHLFSLIYEYALNSVLSDRAMIEIILTHHTKFESITLVVSFHIRRKASIIATLVSIYWIQFQGSTADQHSRFGIVLDDKTLKHQSKWK